MNTYFVLSVCVTCLFLGMGFGWWRGRLPLLSRLRGLKVKTEALAKEYQRQKIENEKYADAYIRLKECSISRVKELRTEIFKMEHHSEQTSSLTEKLKVQNENITKKITQLYDEKRSQIQGLEQEIETLKEQAYIATTSADQMKVLKVTVSRLEGILDEEASEADKQLLVLEERLLKLDPIDIMPNKQKTFEDDLTEIVGIGPKLAETLNQYGIKSFRQLADMSESEVSEIGRALGGFGERIVRDQWVEQARELDKFRH